MSTPFLQSLLAQAAQAPQPATQQGVPGALQAIAVTPTVAQCVGKTAQIQFSLSSPFLPGQRGDQLSWWHDGVGHRADPGW